MIALAGRRQRDVADVILEPEGGVVDPHGPSAVKRRAREALAVARHEVQARLDQLEQLAEGRRWPIEGRQGADVHVRLGSLLMKEGGIERGQAIEMLLRHRATA